MPARSRSTACCSSASRARVSATVASSSPASTSARRLTGPSRSRDARSRASRVSSSSMLGRGHRGAGRLVREQGSAAPAAAGRARRPRWPPMPRGRGRARDCATASRSRKPAKRRLGRGQLGLQAPGPTPPGEPARRARRLGRRFGLGQLALELRQRRRVGPLGSPAPCASSPSSRCQPLPQLGQHGLRLVAPQHPASARLRSTLSVAVRSAAASARAAVSASAACCRAASA